MRCYHLRSGDETEVGGGSTLVARIGRTVDRTTAARPDTGADRTIVATTRVVDEAADRLPVHTVESSSGEVAQAQQPNLWTLKEQA